jgi:hypothetical protein
VQDPTPLIGVLLGIVNIFRMAPTMNIFRRHSIGVGPEEPLYIHGLTVLVAKVCFALRRYIW